MPEMSETHKAKVRQTFNDALLPFAFHTEIRRILKRTPEYQQALAEGRAKAWLDSETDSLGEALAWVVRDRLERLEP